jgi:pyruvate/2-oxoglutarate dehydrogenase complex dihydrolipoamide acyltransferase (E2) component
VHVAPFISSDVNLPSRALTANSLISSEIWKTLNTSFNEEAGEIVHKHYWNIGIAADTDRGLLVPVVKNADRKSLSAETNALTT